MISRGVEISIAGGVVAMVRVFLFNRWRCCCNGSISWSEPSALYRHLLTTLSLVTHHLTPHKPLRLIVSHSAKSINDSYESLPNLPLTNQNS